MMNSEDHLGYVGSHHEMIRVAGRIIGYMRVTNSGEIISIWINDPYNKLFLPEVEV
jgi:hypothetical protein